MTAVMLVTLLGLGTWQVNRMVWKADILAAIALAERAPPVPLGATPPRFARVRAEGVFHPVTALYGAEVRTVATLPTGGARLLAVLQRDGAAPVLVDRGWVPVGHPASPPPAMPAEPASVEGYVRPPDSAGPFAATDDLANRRFFTLDPATIGPALGIPNLAPFILVALGPAGSPTMGNPTMGNPDPARTLPRPANNHLAYAITWYGLAAGLLVIFALYARKVLRP
jgi:surfeit locus 1 family protein